jgi:hypothetical protein
MNDIGGRQLEIGQIIAYGAGRWGLGLGVIGDLRIDRENEYPRHRFRVYGLYDGDRKGMNPWVQHYRHRIVILEPYQLDPVMRERAIQYQQRINDER